MIQQLVIFVSVDLLKLFSEWLAWKVFLFFAASTANQRTVYEKGTDNSTFSLGVALDKEGNIYAGDMRGGKLFKIDPM